MDKVILDTNVIVRYLKSVDGVLADILGQYELKLSVVSVAELLATKRASNQSTQKEVHDFVKENFEVLPVSQEIAARAGDILRELDVTLAHALVAATAIQYDLPLLTYETSIFDRIPDLQIVDIQ